MTVIAVPYHLDEYLPDLDLPLMPAEVVTAPEVAAQLTAARPGRYRAG
jgi:arginase